MKKEYIAPLSKNISLAGEAPLLADSFEVSVIEGETEEQGSNRRHSIWDE